MTKLTEFSFEHRRSVRVFDLDGEGWFVLNDVCAVLAITNQRNAAARLDDDEKGVRIVDTLGGRQQVTIVSEAGLYSLILASRKPEAKRFKRWVTHEVLPSIRRTGSYRVPTGADPQRAIAFLLDQQLRILQAVKLLACGDGIVFAPSLPEITGLSPQKVERTLCLFEALDLIRREDTDHIRLLEPTGGSDDRGRARRGITLSRREAGR